ncbi:SLBB domain-containing protein [Shewanella sp. AS1]|uniref:SLBB domain-containing protein n=1 Tax=Shewanella sp. AS1 TaxID=2907626 RepID=UPI001F41FF53|nr:SLBB domain-containing protein [Shewanella sp. AS1]MCE9680050.1 SLBB domain-containing protein [Shewanella sp. AS1]
MLQRTTKTIITAVAALFMMANFFIIASSAQAITPSPEMIEQFKNLPASEQQRLARQYGIDPALLTGKGTTQSDLANPELVLPRNSDGQFENTDKLQGLKNANEELDFAKEQQKKELKRFGYELFQGEPTTFAPVSDVPVPSEYLVGPGDRIKVQLFGKDNQEYDLVISRDGTIQFPQLGPISVAGLSFAELRESLNHRIKQQMIGIESNITMGELRSIRIFIAGDAYKPGSYTVSSLSTITQALFVAGGVNEIGSLRDIQVKRNGKLVGSMDLYDLLMRGDASGDLRLRSGDVVFIPPVGGLVSIEGEVRRPAIYELKQNETVADIVAMAAGVTPGAYPKSSTIERFNSNGLRGLVNVDLTTQAGKSTKAQAGDYIRVKNASVRFEDAITLVGAVVRPGKYQWYDGQKISDLLPSLWGDLLISADLNYGIIIRETNRYGDIKVLQFSPAKAIGDKQTEQDLTLQPRDKIMLFNYSDEAINRFELNKLVKDRVEEITSLTGDSLVGNDLFKAGFAELDKTQLESRSDIAGVVVTKDSSQETEEELAKKEAGELVTAEVKKMLFNLFDDKELIKQSGAMNRGELLYPVVTKLISQGMGNSGAPIVAINGKVRHPGIYPLADKAKISDLVMAAGGLLEGAYSARAELTSSVLEGEYSTVSHLDINLDAAISGQASEDKVLQPRDILTVMTTPDWQENKTVEIRGEVKFPGIYNIRRGEKLSDVIERAGGFTQYAFLPSSVFVRESVRQQEQIEIKKLADQLRRDIATRGVSKDGNVVNYTDAQLMLSDLENIKAVGRLVVDLPAISVGIAQADIQLEDQDILYIPSTRETISVMGEVQHAATHRFKDGLTLDQYLSMSGGVRKRADDDRIYIIKADGSVMLPSRTMWFSSTTELSPGDTIIVPLDTEYKDNLTLWTQITGIIYNTAVAISAISGL